jgi:membrane-associated phospholipid phosphatase
MKQRISIASFLLLILLPFSVFAREPVSEKPKWVPAQYFSLSIRHSPSAPTIPAWALSSVPGPSARSATEKFTFRSLSRDSLKDAGEIWSYPVHIRSRDILPIAGVAVLTGFLIGNDAAIRRGFLDYQARHAWVRAVSPVITEMGSFAAWGTAAAFLCVGLIGKDNKAVETGTLAASAMLQGGILVAFLKGMFGRRRPYSFNAVDRWSGPVGFFKRFGSGQYGLYDSFPGGHSVTAFSLATVVAMQYRKSVWVPVLAYTTAMGAALSRVTEGRHWLSDCLVGGILGHVIGRLVVLNHRSRHHILPGAGGDKGSVSFAVTFCTH